MRRRGGVVARSICEAPTDFRSDPYHSRTDQVLHPVENFFIGSGLKLIICVNHFGRWWKVENPL
jgi:hypothetical protein